MRDMLDDTLTTLQSAAAATGNGTQLDVHGYAAVVVQLTGTFVGTVIPEVTLDGTNWVTAEGMKLTDSSRAASATGSGTGIYVFPVLGCEYFRLRVSAYSSGAVTAKARGITQSAAALMPDVQLSTGTITVGTVDQGNGGASAWLVDTELPAAAALTDGAALPATTPSVGAILRGINGGTLYTIAAFNSAGDAVAGGIALDVIAHSYLFDGTTSNRQRGNTEVAVLASAARTTTQTQADQTNHNARGVHVVIDVTSAGTGSITPKIQGKDANGIYYDILVGAAITATGTTVLKIYPGITATANASASDVLPRTYRVVVTANNANTMTYSVAAELVV